MMMMRLFLDIIDAWAPFLARDIGDAFDMIPLCAVTYVCDVQSVTSVDRL